MGLLLLILLVVVVIGAAPRWNCSRNWGYGPSGLMGIALIVLVCLMLFDVIHWRTLSY